MKKLYCENLVLYGIYGACSQLEYQSITGINNLGRVCTVQYGDFQV